MEDWKLARVERSIIKSFQCSRENDHAASGPGDTPISRTVAVRGPAVVRGRQGRAGAWLTLPAPAGPNRPAPTPQRPS